MHRPSVVLHEAMGLKVTTDEFGVTITATMQRRIPPDEARTIATAILAWLDQPVTA